jgi:hypothetical protein
VRPRVFELHADRLVLDLVQGEFFSADGGDGNIPGGGFENGAEDEAAATDLGDAFGGLLFDDELKRVGVVGIEPEGEARGVVGELRGIGGGELGEVAREAFVGLERCVVHETLAHVSREDLGEEPMIRSRGGAGDRCGADDNQQGEQGGEGFHVR